PISASTPAAGVIAAGGSLSSRYTCPSVTSVARAKTSCADSCAVIGSSLRLQALVRRDGQHHDTGDHFRVEVGAFLRHALALPGDLLDVFHACWADEKDEVPLAAINVLDGCARVAVVAD